MKNLIDIYNPSYRRQFEENSQSPLEYLRKRGLANKTITYFKHLFLNLKMISKRFIQQKTERQNIFLWVLL